MMPGMIMLWHGSVATIPSGWHVCDGTMGTPNLVNKFVLGAKAAPPPNISGGLANHVHDFTGDGHDHEIPGGTGIESGINFYPYTSHDQAVGTTDSESSYPPYYTLCYIMKL